MPFTTLIPDAFKLQNTKQPAEVTFIFTLELSVADVNI